MRKLFAVFFFCAASALANETSYRSLQSGTRDGATPLHDRGLHGQGQIIAVLDTGLEWRNCWFAEADGSAPPFNTGSPAGGLEWQNVDPSRRKVIAYDFLYSCDQYPGRAGCETPSSPDAFDNQGHGTHAAAAAAGDQGTPLAHDYGDAIAPGAQLVIQDAGFIGGDNCSQRPGMGCPVALTPILEQAYRQGARIHSNSWGDRQGTPYPLPSPTANYPQSARDVDAFIVAHPDFLVVFNTGNFGAEGFPPPSTLSAPGSAKNTLQIGGTRAQGNDDSLLTSYTLVGPTTDGRIKPDLVGPAAVIGGDIDINRNGNYCDDVTRQHGTSWASPTIAGAAALVRQYYTDGFHPSGVRNAAHGLTPSAALLKATLISAARPATHRWNGSRRVAAAPVPSNEQGWGFPVLDDALYFAGDTSKLRIEDVPLANGLAQGESRTIRVRARAGTPLKAVLVWTDPAGSSLVNDLDLTIDGSGMNDHVNNVEVVSVGAETREYAIVVKATRVAAGRQGYALVVTGDLENAAARRRAAGR